jgi:hypothetical protein
MRFLLTVLLGAVLAAPAWAGGNSRIVIHGVVIAVDPARSLVALHHEAFETGAAGNQICRLRRHRDLRGLTRGTVIEAVAETNHQPWVLDDVHVRARTLLPRTTTAI